MKTTIHINRHVINSNRRNEENNPPITVKTYKSNDYCHEVIIKDKEGNEVARVVHRPECPKSCGAVVWVETQHEVEIVA